MRRLFVLAGVTRADLVAIAVIIGLTMVFWSVFMAGLLWLDI